MTSRRKAKRADWIEYPENMFVRNEDGSTRPLSWPRRWYEKKGRKHKLLDYDPDPMWGCVKKSIQQRHRGSWNGIGIDPWYHKGLISWRRGE